MKYDLLTGRLIHGCSESGSGSGLTQSDVICSIPARVDYRGTYAQISQLFRECGSMIFREVL